MSSPFRNKEYLILQSEKSDYFLGSSDEICKS